MSLFCAKTPKVTRWHEKAYGKTDGAASVRATVRTDRNFTLWGPNEASGSFGETHTYFWAREYMRWNKPALAELGELAADPDDRPVLNIVVNACDGDFRATSFDVTKTDNHAEKGAKIILREDCRKVNVFCFDDLPGSSSFVTCEDNGCHPSASVIHHELNHFVMGSYLGVGSGLDCNNDDQRKFLHEGTFGSTIPHMFWHHWYGVGYNPPTSSLFTSSSVRGRVHADGGSRLTISGYLCTNNDNPDDNGSLGQQPYEAGRVAGQPLWELYHGQKVDGSTISNTARFTTDTDALIYMYSALELVNASTYKDRYELANRMMQLVDKNGDAVPTSIKQQWCSIFNHHEMNKFMPASYCT